MCIRSVRGFTLIELMIAVAILAIIAAIAIPAYNAYIRESRLGAMRMNLDTLRIALEAHRLDVPAANYGPTNTYITDKTKNEIAYFGWEPEGDNQAYSYTVYASSVSVPFYRMSAFGSGLWYRCDKDATQNPSFACCDCKGTTTSCCLSSCR